MRIIGGQFKGRILKAPKGDTTRPTSSRLREALFNITQGEIEESSILDVCSGSGAIGLEALSRGARFSCFIDSNSQAIFALKDNLKTLKIEPRQGRIFHLDAFKAMTILLEEGISFDMIYVDPPYAATTKKAAGNACLAARMLDLVDKSLILNKGGSLFIEEGGAFEKVGELTTLTESKARDFGKSILTHYVKN